MKKKTSLKGLCFLLLLLLTGACSVHTGVQIHPPGQAPYAVTPETEQQLPQGVGVLRIAPFDVLQIDVSPKRMSGTLHRADYANEVRCEFYFTGKQYHIAPGDILGLELTTESDKVYEIVVLPNGQIRLPRIGIELSALGLTLAELNDLLTKEYSVLLKNTQLALTIQKSSLNEQLQELSGNYSVDRDGNLVFPYFGSFQALGLNGTEIANGIRSIASNYFYNQIEVATSISSLTSSTIDPSISQDGRQYFRDIVKVSTDGTVFVREAGVFLASNKTLAELSESIQQAFNHIYQNPVDVYVTLQDSPNLNLFIGGEVSQPGTYPFQNNQTLVQLISTAGWTTAKADMSQVVLLHAVDENSYVLYRTNLIEVLEGKAGIRQDLKLSPRDVVIVPESGIARADSWVDQYIRRLLPFGMNANYTIVEQSYTP